MKITDRVYGNIEIKDQVIIDLINTPPFQRLKNISQVGATRFIQPTRNVTRYEHSIGVWYLSNRFKRSMEEQIASLLHDLSHTAFSHVIDVVLKDDTHEYADRLLNKVILNSEIPNIIKSHGYNLKKVLDKTKFPLLDNNLPDISVDRWDYFMRDGNSIGFLPKNLIDIFLNNIFEKNNTFYFKDVRLASTFAILFVSFSRLIWLDPTSDGSYYLLADAIKEGLNDKLITEEDFFTDDITLLTKLKTSKNKRLISLLKRLSPGKEFIYIDKDKADYYGSNKPRYVDPFVEVDGKLNRLTTLVPSLSYYYEEFKERYKYIGVRQLNIN